MWLCVVGGILITRFQISRFLSFFRSFCFISENSLFTKGRWRISSRSPLIRQLCYLRAKRKRCTLIRVSYKAGNLTVGNSKRLGTQKHKKKRPWIVIHWGEWPLGETASWWWHGEGSQASVVLFIFINIASLCRRFRLFCWHLSSEWSIFFSLHSY